MLFLVAVFTVASGQCVDPSYQPGQIIVMVHNTTICDEAVKCGLDCSVLAKCLEMFQNKKISDPNAYDTLTFYVPKPYEVKAAEKELGIGTEKTIAVAVALKKKSKPISHLWTKKFAAAKYQEKYLMERYTLRPGENIFSVGQRYQKNPQVLVWFNGLKNPESLHAGQTINIPDTSKTYWINLRAAPLGSSLILDALAECDFPDPVKDTMVTLIQAGVKEDGCIEDGQELQTMASAPLNKNGKHRLNTERHVVAVFNNGECYHSELYKVRVGDQIFVGADPDVCDNFSTWTESVPKIPDTVQTPPPPTTPPVLTENPPETPPVDTGWGAPPDTSTASPATEAAGSPLINNQELFAWVGHAFPPYFVDGETYYGGRFNYFFRGVFGFNLEANGWDGYGPQVSWYRYFGFCPAIGPSLQWANNRIKLTLFADVAWQYDYGYNNNFYTSKQYSWFVYPGFTYLFVTGNGHWLEGYLDYKQDVSHRRDAEVSGAAVVNAPVDKSCTIFGTRWFFISFPTKTPLDAGLTAKAMYLNEDHRVEMTIGPTLSINYHLKFGLEYKRTINSSDPYNNGTVYGASLDVDLWNIFR